MEKAAKVAISLPRRLLEEADRETEYTGESRSQLIRRALEFFLRTEGEAAAEARYIEGYRKFPETEQELAWADASKDAFVESPW